MRCTTCYGKRGVKRVKREDGNTVYLCVKCRAPKPKPGLKKERKHGKHDS